MRGLNFFACLLACVAFAPRAWAYEPGICAGRFSCRGGQPSDQGRAGQPLLSLYVTTGATAGYVMTFNATGAPADGTVTPIECVMAPANSTVSISFDGPPDIYSIGIVAVFSTTGCFLRLRVRPLSSKRGRNEVWCRCRGRLCSSARRSALGAVGSVWAGQRQQRRRRPIGLSDRRRRSRLGRIGADPRRRWPRWKRLQRRTGDAVVAGSFGFSDHCGRDFGGKRRASGGKPVSRLAERFQRRDGTAGDCRR